MAAKAAEEALADSGLKAEEIDLILVATSFQSTILLIFSAPITSAVLTRPERI